jgi:hypothetical protein
LVSQQGHHLLSLSRNEFQNGEIRLVAPSGRVISSEKLSGINQTSVTLHSVAQGIYILNVRGVDGANFSSKIRHGGGDLRFATSFNGNFEVGGVANSRIITTEAARESRSSANFTLRFTTQGLGDTTVILTPTQGMNPRIEISFADPNELPSERFQELFSREQFERMFPNRYGFGSRDCANRDAPAGCSQGTTPTNTGDGIYDFYSYNALLMAIDLVGNVEIDLSFAAFNNGLPAPGAYRIEQRNKRTGDIRVFTVPEYNRWTNKIHLGKIDYADFVSKGTISNRRQELAAFLANITQETTGFGSVHLLVGANAQPHHWTWGLYWRTECEAGVCSPYASPDPLGYHNPVAGKLYYGRGAKQLTHPYNYGPFSEFIFGDRFVLLNNPENVIPRRVGNEENGILAFAAAIWFWMTPQPPKPSCHEVYQPGFNTVRNGRNYSRFAWTVSIINGGLECAGTNTANDYRVGNRIGHYRQYLRILGEEEPQGDLLSIGCDGLVIN